MQGFDPAAQGAFAVTARALKERLSRFFPAPQFALELMPAGITRAVWQRMTTRMPFVGIAFLGADVEATAGVNPLVTQRWQLHLVVAGNTAELRLLGDRQSPGLANMAAVAMLATHAFTIDDVGTVSCGSAVSLAAEFLADNQAVLGIPLSIPTTLVADDAVAALDDLAALDLTWNFNPVIAPPAASDAPAGDDTIAAYVEG